MIATKWYCTYSPAKQGFDFFLLAKLDNYGPWCYAETVNFTKPTDNELTEPLLFLKEDQAQQLIDALWTGGLRPTEGHGSAGQVAAVEKHLEDMQKIVFEAVLPLLKKENKHG